MSTFLLQVHLLFVANYELEVGSIIQKYWNTFNNLLNYNIMDATFNKSVRDNVKHRWVQLLIGISFIGTAIFTFTSPLSSYLALSILFSVSFLVSGFFGIIFAIANRKQLDQRGWSLALGIITLMAGIMLIANPQISMVSLPLYVGFIVMFRSAAAMGMAMDLKNYGVMEWGNLMVAGVLGLIFSFFLIFNPLFAGLSLVVWTGLAFLAISIFNVYLSLKLRKLRRT